MKVLTALRFYATGSYQQVIANDFLIRMTQSSASNCIRSVSQAICNKMLRSWISFPDNAQDLIEMKLKFHNISQFPGVIGAVDCTHVALYGVSGDFDEQNFINRKNYHSINVQIICDADLKILNMDVRFPGATHDSYVWKSSLIHSKFQSRILASDGSSWLLGDSGYPLQPWLLTPVSNARDGSPEARYNNAHIATRNPVERCNGVLKSRFRCLLKDRTLHYDPLTTASDIIYACGVLHNMCIENNILPVEDDEDNSSDGIFNSGRDNSTTVNSQRFRQALINSRFS